MGILSGLSRAYSFASVAVSHPIHLRNAIALGARLRVIDGGRAASLPLPRIPFSSTAHAAQLLAEERGLGRGDLSVQLRNAQVPLHHVARISIAAAKRSPDRILAWLRSDKISDEAKMRILDAMSEARFEEVIRAAAAEGEGTLAESLLELTPTSAFTGILEHSAGPGSGGDRRAVIVHRLTGPKLGEALSDPAVSPRTITQVLTGYGLAEDKKRETVSHLSGDALRRSITQDNFYVPATDRYAELIAANLNPAAMAAALVQTETWGLRYDQREKFIKFLAELSPDKMAAVFTAMLGGQGLPEREFAYAAITLYVLLGRAEPRVVELAAQALSIMARTDPDRIGRIFTFNDNLIRGSRGSILQRTRYVSMEVNGLSDEMAVAILKQMEAGLAERILAAMVLTDKTAGIKRAMRTT